MSQDSIWEANKVAWRCRRGLWELDVILQNFYTQHYHSLSNKEKIDFQWLLLQTDPYLQKILVYKEEHREIEHDKCMLIKKIISKTIL